MTRRSFLKVVSVGSLGPSFVSCANIKQRARYAARTRDQFTAYFLTILSGFLRNARATSDSYAVCDFPGGTKLAGCCTPRKKTFTSVARMLPALAEFVASGHPAPLNGVNLHHVLLSIFTSAFNPQHPDYWGEPVGKKPTQRTVESSLVAIALAKLGPAFVRELSSPERSNLNRWLASCTVVPERTNNHAWFTAVNQAVRLKLGRTFPEFAGDEKWMLDDLKAMDVLAANAADGWYSDDPKLTVYDYYNFWTFGNFPLFWSRIAGEMYPEWNAKLRARAREFLQNTPYFFACDGAIPLFGRSLLYRWSVLSPLILGYEQGIWPHSAGLLRRIIRRNFDWWWRMGAYDEPDGKLRETLSSEGTRDVSEPYIDNGHPYWAMQAFTIFSIPDSDPLWTAPEEKLPVEKADYLVKIKGPKMILAGTKSSGQVRWLQALNTPRRDYYRDKYNKFVWSSSFPFNVVQHDKSAVPWDQALVFRDPSSGAFAWRVFPDSGELIEDGVRTRWSTKLGTTAIHVVSTIRLLGEFEFRVHRVNFEAAPVSPAESASRLSPVEVLEGSYPLGLAQGEQVEQQGGQGWLGIHSRTTGTRLATWALSDQTLEVTEKFPGAPNSRVNLVSPRMALITLSKTLQLPTSKESVVRSLHYASPKPFSPEALHSRAREILSKLRASFPALRSNPTHGKLSFPI